MMHVEMIVEEYPIIRNNVFMDVYRQMLRYNVNTGQYINAITVDHNVVLSNACSWALIASTISKRRKKANKEEAATSSMSIRAIASFFFVRPSLRIATQLPTVRNNSCAVTLESKEVYIAIICDILCHELEDDRFMILQRGRKELLHGVLKEAIEKMGFRGALVHGGGRGKSAPDAVVHTDRSAAW